jgi:hypothetical protein
MSNIKKRKWGTIEIISGRKNTKLLEILVLMDASQVRYH